MKLSWKYNLSLQKVLSFQMPDMNNWKGKLFVVLLFCLYWPTALWRPSAKMHTRNYLNITMFRTVLNKMKMQTMMKKLIIHQLRFLFAKVIIIAIILHSKIKTYSFNYKPKFYKALYDVFYRVTIWFLLELITCIKHSKNN